MVVTQAALRNFFGTMSIACNFILESPKRVKKLESLIDDGGDSHVKRWRFVVGLLNTVGGATERREAVSVFVQLLHYVIKLLEAVEGDMQAEVTANGIPKAKRSGVFLVAEINDNDPTSHHCQLSLGITLPLSRRFQDPSTISDKLWISSTKPSNSLRMQEAMQRITSPIFSRKRKVSPRNSKPTSLFLAKLRDRSTGPNIPAESSMDHYTVWPSLFPTSTIWSHSWRTHFRSRSDILQVQGRIPQCNGQR